MSGRFWRSYLEKDHLSLLARQWQVSAWPGAIASVFFLLLGVVCWMIGILSLDKMPDGPTARILICALFCSAAFGMAGLICAGTAVASLAYSTQRRLKELDDRLSKMEPSTVPLPPRPNSD
jgi:hypothetical protein